MSEIRPNESASNASSSVSTQRPKSIVWDHFKVSEADKTKAICSHCPKGRTSSHTTTMELRTWSNTWRLNMLLYLRIQINNEALFQKAFSQDDQGIGRWCQFFSKLSPYSLFRACFEFGRTGCVECLSGRLGDAPKSYQKNQVDTTLKPILDVATRWNSTADMLERAILL